MKYTVYLLGLLAGTTSVMSIVESRGGSGARQGSDIIESISRGSMSGTSQSAPSNRSDEEKPRVFYSGRGDSTHTGVRQIPNSSVRSIGGNSSGRGHSNTQIDEPNRSTRTTHASMQRYFDPVEQDSSLRKHSNRRSYASKDRLVRSYQDGRWSSNFYPAPHRRGDRYFGYAGEESDFSRGRNWGTSILGAVLTGDPVIDYEIASPYEGCNYTVDGDLICEDEGTWYYAS